MNQSENSEVIASDPWRRQKDYLMGKYEKLFPEWHLSLRYAFVWLEENGPLLCGVCRLGMNVLLYGVGSKKGLMELFRERELSQEATLVVEGFKPECTLKSVFSAFHEKVLEEPPPKDPVTLLKSLGSYISENFDHFNLILHSIDGPSLRNSAAQKMLCEFAQIPGVHLVVSMDHPNLPLLWSLNEVNHFKWVYHRVSTFANYDEFSIPDLSTAGPHSSSLLLASLHHVFGSLTSNAKKIYQEIAKHQVHEELGAIPTREPGIPYKRLYTICRAEFYISSDAALRKQLVEFYDHKLLRSHKGPHGVEHLAIPIDKDALRGFLDSIEE